MNLRKPDRWWPTAVIVLAWLLAFWDIAHAAPLTCAPVVTEPPALFMRALELTESSGWPRPGDDGKSHGRYQISVNLAADCMGVPYYRLSDPLVIAGLVAAAKLDANNREWARRLVAFCFTRIPRSNWSQAYRCYNAGPWSEWMPNHQHVLNFQWAVRHLRAEYTRKRKG